jgi:nicotinate-nucleotide--dimethylbenzimidazole phosphoribosyltransferase
VNALAGRHGARIVLVDVGVAGDLSAVPRAPVVALRSLRVRAGTRNLRREPALTRAEALHALDAGASVAAQAAEDGADLLALGEIGIGNTTSAAALVCAFTGESADEVVGTGTGLGTAAFAHKIAVVRDALALHRPDAEDALGVLAALGGLEIAAMAGCAIEAARHRLPVVVDGFIASAAALLASRLDPGVITYLLAAHASAERGARGALRALGLSPLFDFGLRLGEGTGAVIAADLVRTAVTTQLSMATFATAGIVGRAGTEIP